MELRQKGHNISRLRPGLTLSGVSGVYRFEDGSIQGNFIPSYRDIAAQLEDTDSYTFISISGI